MNNVKLVSKTIRRLDLKKNNPDWPYIEAAVNSSVLTNKPLILISFTCSTINPKFMFNQKNPQNYVSLDPTGNNLEQDLDRLERIYTQLNKYTPVRLIIIIGNTDPFYIYSQETKVFSEISEVEFWKRFERRWKIYKSNLKKNLTQLKPKLKIEVISWYELEKTWELNQAWNFRTQFIWTKNNINQFFNKEDLAWELKSLTSAFGEGKYFDNLTIPPKSTLKEWIKRKFAEYSVQGLWIKLIFPDAILLQNEKPSNLRTKMYQPLIKKFLNSNLPIIYPFGVDNLGFQ